MHGARGRIIENPAARNRTRDHLIAADFYSQMLYQLSYSRAQLLPNYSILEMVGAWGIQRTTCALWVRGSCILVVSFVASKCRIAPVP